MIANFEALAMDSDAYLTDIEDLDDDLSLQLSSVVNIDTNGLRLLTLDGGCILGIMQIEL